MKIKAIRRGASLVLAASLALYLTACFGGGSSGSEEAAETAETAPLRVGIISGDDSYARYVSAGSGSGAGASGTQSSKESLEGLEPGIISQLASMTGQDIEYKLVDDTEELLQLLNEGTVDIAAGRLAWLASYEDSYIQSDIYSRDGLYLLTKENDYSDMLAGMAGETLGISASISDTALLEVSGLDDMTTAVFSDVTSAASDIEADRIKAALCTEREAIKALESGAAVQAQELHNGPREGRVFLLLPGNETLAAYLNTAIGTYLDIQSGGLPQDENQ